MISLIDSQWVLRRNFYAIKKSRAPDYKSLINSFYSSICKICEETSSSTPFLVWDRGPYFKEKTLTLKTSRYYAKESDKVEIPPEATEEERRQLEEKNKWIGEQAAMESEFQHAKNHIIKFSSEFGMPSVYYVGFEADDIAYLIANSLGIKTDIRFLTLDSDWHYSMGPNTEFVRLTKYKQVSNYKDLNRTSKVPLILEGIFRTLLSDNHNDVDLIDLGISTERAMELYEKYDLSESDWIRETGKTELEVRKFIERVNALNPNTFLNDEIKNQIISQLKTNVSGHHMSEFFKLSKDLGLRVNIPKVWDTYKKRRNYINLFEESVIRFPDL